jgi:hypothetical protein
MTPTPVSTFACVDPASLPERIASSPDPFVVVALFVVIGIPALLWTASEWQTWRERRERRASGRLFVTGKRRL